MGFKRGDLVRVAVNMRPLGVALITDVPGDGRRGNPVPRIIGRMVVHSFAVVLGMREMFVNGRIVNHVHVLTNSGAVGWIPEHELVKIVDENI